MMIEPERCVPYVLCHSVRGVFCMKIVCVVLFGAAIIFCALGLSGHKEAWAAAALCFFAATMGIARRR